MKRLQNGLRMKNSLTMKKNDIVFLPIFKKREIKSRRKFCTLSFTQYSSLCFVKVKEQYLAKHYFKLLKGQIRIR